VYDHYGAQVRRQLEELRQQLSAARATIDGQQREALKTAARLRATEAERDLLRGMAERVPETHMQFGVISPDGAVEMQPCADWCWACKLDAAQARAEQAKARIAAVRTVLDRYLGCASDEAAVLRAEVREALGATAAAVCPDPALVAAEEALTRVMRLAEMLPAEVRAQIGAAIDGPAYAGQVNAPVGQPAVCCECGSTDVVYRNYRGMPFCCPCAQCCSSPADGPS
jgi:type II secretory pathway pseudopilin PulG